MQAWYMMHISYVYYTYNVYEYIWYMAHLIRTFTHRRAHAQTPASAGHIVTVTMARWPYNCAMLPHVHARNWVLVRIISKFYSCIYQFSAAFPNIIIVRAQSIVRQKKIHSAPASRRRHRSVWHVNRTLAFNYIYILYILWRPTGR